jgi:ankyrin repeat protein
VKVSHTPRHLFIALVAFVLPVAALAAQSIPPVDAVSTPLHWAAEEGLLTIAQGLLDNGALVDAVDQFGRTPLHKAVRHEAMVEFLLAAGADPNVQDQFGATPLHLALSYPESVRLLLAAGASIAVEDYLGRTPLERSIKLGNTARNRGVIEQLIAAGAGAPAVR